MLRDLTEDGVRVFGAVGGDLTGWLGDLAPAYGDLDSIHLLYRLCCLYDCSATPTTDPALHNLIRHLNYRSNFLMPFLAMARQVAPAAQQYKQPRSSSSSTASQAAEQQRTDHSKSLQGPTSHAQAPSAKHGSTYLASLYTRFIDALQCSSSWLEFLTSSDLYFCGQLEVGGDILDLVQKWLLLPSDQPTLREKAEAMAAQIGFKVPPYPKDALVKLLHSYQPDVWEASWRVAYRPQQEAGHAQLLEAYVTGVARRLMEEHPGLQADVMEALGWKE
jgi:hypothetical protein